MPRLVVAFCVAVTLGAVVPLYPDVFPYASDAARANAALDYVDRELGARPEADAAQGQPMAVDAGPIHADRQPRLASEIAGDQTTEPALFAQHVPGRCGQACSQSPDEDEDHESRSREPHACTVSDGPASHPIRALPASTRTRPRRERSPERQ